MKKILFIGLPYHSYIEAISREMESLGYGVTFYPVELRTTRLKTLRALSKSTYNAELYRFHAHLLEKEKNNQYEYIVFLQVHTFSRGNFLRLKNEHPEAKIVFYSWDALSPIIDYRPYLPYFDKAYTFDPEDAKQCGIKYLPLFCLRDFQNLSTSEYDYDVYMVGNMVKPARYKAVMQFENYCKANGLYFKKYLKCTPVVMFKLLLNGIIPRGLKLRSIPQKEFISFMQSSKATFDFANHKQSGYTMRFIENLCAGKKIITNNRRVLHEPFYSPDRFFVFENLSFDGVKEFLEMPIKNPEEHFEQFYIQTFVRMLLS
jgi:hypothetical protein